MIHRRAAYPYPIEVYEICDPDCEYSIDKQIGLEMNHWEAVSNGIVVTGKTKGSALHKILFP